MNEGKLKINMKLKEETPPQKTTGELKTNIKLQQVNNLKLEEFSEEWLSQQTLINRDSGAEYFVEEIQNTTSGNTPKRMVKLRSKNGTVSKEFSDLISIIKTPNSAWEIKK
jgi:DNA-directed RNA polymerase specialized sigma54-like protein